MKLAKCVFTVILVLFALSQIAHSQQNASIEVKANILVLDSNNQLINDVKQEDIKIFEDGVEQKITAFTKKEPALNVGLIIDNTGSMRHQLDQIIWTGKMISANLSVNDSEFVVRFVSTDKIRLLQDWILPQVSPQNQAKVQTVLDNLFIEGGQSAVIDAIHFSATKMIERESQNKSQRYALVLISDGEDRDSLHNEKELIELMKTNQIEFYSIAFIGDIPKTGEFVRQPPQERIKKFLNNLSNETGGVSYFLEKENPKQDSITPALKRVMYELRSQYTIGYTSTNQKRDGKPRKLTVQIADSEKGEKRTGIIREGFTVPKK